VRWAEDYELWTTALSRLTQIHSYAILCLHLYRAASSMAEQAPLKRKVQGSTPWQPTFYPHHLLKHPTLTSLLFAFLI
jgi:hypothetical protein